MCRCRLWSIHSSLTAIVLLCLTVPQFCAAQEREWVDRTGKHTLRGVFEKLEDGQVFLRRSDGVAIKIPLEQLAESNQALIRKLVKKPGDGDPVEDSDDNNQSTPKTDPDRRFNIDAPTKKLDFLGPADLKFRSTIDVNRVRQLPEGIQELAMVLHQRENVVTVGEAFAKIAQLDSIPAVVVDLLRETSNSKNRYLRTQSMKLLGVFDAQNSLDRILAALDDPSFNVRWATLELIQALYESQAVTKEQVLDPLVNHFPGPDRSKIIGVLTSFGALAEDKILPLLDHEDPDVVVDAVTLLTRIGGEKSIKRLETFAENENITLRLHCKSSIRKIQERIQLD